MQNLLDAYHDFNLVQCVPNTHVFFLSDLDTECTRLQDLDLVAGTQLKVLVTDVSTPTSFVVQPFGVELVEMSEKMM